MKNILLEDFKTPYATVPFEKIKNEDFLPALNEAIELARTNIKKIKNDTAKPTFFTVCEPLEHSDEKLQVVSSVFFNLNSAETNDEMQEIAKEFSPKLTEFQNEVLLDADLFSKLKTVYEQKDKENLSVEQKMLLDKQYKDFTRNGALLDEKEKSELVKIDRELSMLQVKFSENVLKATNEYEIHVTDEKKLKGIPDYAIEAAKQEAVERGHKDGWSFTLQFPSYIALMTYAEDRDLRKQMWEARSKLAYKHKTYDNSETLKQIVNLRHTRAKLLGKKSHSDFVLEERMASQTDTVLSFLQNILNKALPAGKKELEQLKKFAKENGGLAELKKWDTTFWSEKMKTALFDFDDELVRPYFKLENVINGVFEIAKKLYGLNFKKMNNVSLYHQDVHVYDVTDENGKHISVFYADFHPRKGKRSGAWMTSFRGLRVKKDEVKRPHIAIVCNFTKPGADRPSLLSLDEVLTLFHEFGHALHGMLAQGNYESITGTNVYWDFVELPSQIMENWVYEKECLDIFARHYKDNSPIPQDLIEKIIKSKTFLEGLATLRQLSFGLLDMAWHASDPGVVVDIEKFENEATAQANLMESTEGVSHSCSFGHIFSGGYSAGYYSYKWAEVLDADAFELFKECGIFNKEVATSFKENILSKGGTEHPMELYLKFRGREPSPDALLRRAGLLE